MGGNPYVAGKMAAIPGTMGLGLAGFVSVWTLMMAAMMLPSVAPTALLYAKTIQSGRAVRTAGLVAGRLAGVTALGLAVATIWLPWLAPGLHAAPPMMH